VSIVTDEILFEDLKTSNNESSFNELYKRYSRRIMSYCFRCTGDSDTAKDLMQIVFTKIFEKRDTFTGGNFNAWLMIITRNECLMYKRTSKNLNNIDDYENYLVADNTHFDFKVKENIKKALGEMSNDMREVLELRFFDDLTYEEISEVLGISLALVKVRIHRAKSILIKKIEYLKDELR